MVKRGTGILVLFGFMLMLAVACAENAGEGGNGVGTGQYLISEADYSRLPQWTDGDASGADEAWWEAWEARQGAMVANPEGLYRFVENTARPLLCASDEENPLYSPLSLWYELDLIAALTAHDSRTQILNVLGETSMETLSAQTASLWRSQYWEDDMEVCVPGASLWLNQGVGLGDGVAEALRKERMASVFQGDMRDAQYGQALRQWLNRMTRGMLTDQISSLQFEDDAQISAISTLYCRGEWANPFSKDATAPAVFHATNGDYETRFMNEKGSNVIYRGEGFSACAKTLMGSAKVLFILPDPGVAPNDVIGQSDVYRLMRDMDGWAEQADAMVRFSMPLLDINAQLNLRESLEQLGMTDVFSESAADFSGTLTADMPVCLSSMIQIARVKMDEEGLEAAAITAANVFGALIPPEKEVDFILDRPFAFALLGAKNVPLFMGVVNHP